MIDLVTAKQARKETLSNEDLKKDYINELFEKINHEIFLNCAKGNNSLSINIEKHHDEIEISLVDAGYSVEIFEDKFNTKNTIFVITW